MKGRIVSINPTRGMVAIETTHGYSVCETIDDGLNIGDNINWRGNQPMGYTEVTNVTTEEVIQVYFQGHGISEASLRQQLLF